MCKTFIFASVIVFVSINISNTLNAQQPSPVVLDAVTLEPINQTQTVIGRVVSLKESTVAALLPSAVTKINIKVGQQVKKGESLVILNLERLYWALEKAKAELKLTEANNSAAVAKSTLAKRVFDRLTSLKSSSAFSQAKYDESIAKYEESKALVAASNAEMIIAEQNFNLAKDDYRLGTIRAPFDGVVEERHIEVGESTTLGTPIVTLVSNYTTDGALIDQTETIFDGTDIQDSVNKALDSIDGYYRLMNFPEDSGITNSPGKAEGCVEEGGVWHEDRGWCEYPKQQVECDALMKIIGCGWLWKRLKQGRPDNNNPDALLVWVGSDAFNDAICCTTLNS